MSVINTFLKGETVSAFWNFSTKAVGVVNTFLTISSLTLYQYGVFQLLLSVTGISSDALNLGSSVITNEISRAIAEKNEQRAKKIFIEFTWMRMSIALLLWCGVFFGATALFSSYDLDFIKDMRVISFLFITEAVFLVIKTLCVVRLKFSLIGMRGTLSKIIQFFILMYFFLQGNLGLQALIFSVVLASGLSVVIIIPSFIKTYRQWSQIKAESNPLLFGIFTNYGSWEIVRQIGNRITFRVRPWIIKLFISTEAVAVFSIADMIVSTLQDILPAKTLQSLVPLWIQDKKLSIKMFSYGVKYFLIVGILVSIGGLIVVPPIITIFFSKYKESLPLFYFMLWNIPIFSAAIIVTNYFIAWKKQKFLFFHNIFRNILALCIILATIPFIGLWGLAIESVVIPFVMLLISYAYTKKYNTGFYFDRKIIFSYTQEDRDILKKIFSTFRLRS